LLAYIGGEYQFTVTHGPAGSKRTIYVKPAQLGDPTGVYARDYTECTDAPMSVTVIED
jgi:hypothetical protein